jgi:predicted transcriptional regulator of viral defense system
MKMIKALALSLGETNKPVITKYQLGVVVFGLYRQKRYKGEPVSLQKDVAEAADFQKYLKQLLEDGVLAPHRDLPNGVYSLLGNTKWSAEEAVCAIDPFAYTSHLSAMEYHGITDRVPSKLFMSSPDDKDWKLYAQDKMKRDLQENYEIYRQGNLPLLTRTKIKNIGKKEVKIFHSKHYGAYKKAHERDIRVATIGRTFLDMLRNPDLCGGINHVLETYDRYAETYLKLITNEIDAHGGPIDKVRAGYIIDERLGIKDSIVESWVQYAQRGSSRKLDPAAEFIAVWSDKWLLSLNVFEKNKS